MAYLTLLYQPLEDMGKRVADLQSALAGLEARTRFWIRPPKLWNARMPVRSTARAAIEFREAFRLATSRASRCSTRCSSRWSLGGS